MSRALNLMEVRRLSIAIDGEHGRVSPVEDASFDVPAGRTFALVGESGSGKSLTALAIMDLLPAATTHVRAERLAFAGADLLSLTPAERRSLRGRRMAMIFQEPMTALNPLMRVGDQIAEVLECHLGRAHADGIREAEALLARVGVGDAGRRVRQYPHELSGGMRQRVMIAMALAGRPELLIADEPTTALDVTIQGQLLNLLSDLQHETGMAVLLITHDLAVVARTADHVAVMYAGRVVESGPTGAVLSAPLHPYTRGLLECTPRLDRRAVRLPVIEGSVPGPANRPDGCHFHPRCRLAHDEPRCRTQTPELLARGDGRAVACWKVSP